MTTLAAFVVAALAVTVFTQAVVVLRLALAVAQLRRDVFGDYGPWSPDPGPYDPADTDPDHADFWRAHYGPEDEGR